AIPPNSIINSAILDLHGVAASGSGGSMGVYVHAYVGDGHVQLSDMYVNNPVAGPYNVSLGPPPPLVQFDVTNAINGLYTSGATYAGLMLRAIPTAFTLQFGSNDNGIASARPTLDIAYTAVPEPSTLALAAFGAVALLMARRRLPPG